MNYAKIAIATLGAAVLATTPLPNALTGLGSHAAYAAGKGGGGNGGGGGHGGGGGNGGGHGNSGGHGKSGSSHGNGAKSHTGSKAKAAAVAAAATTVPVATTTEDTSDDATTEMPKNAHGLMASELKGLNAYHASETAFENAAPNSQVGRIATYRKAALDTEQSRNELVAAEAAAALAASDPAYQGRTTAEIEADLAALDPNAPDYQTQYDALNGELAATEAFDAATEQVATATDALASDQDTEAAALDSATGGRQLSPDALDYFRQQLGL